MNKICIFGVGGVGGYFGGKIVLSNPDKKIFFIARGKHLEEIKKNGIILNTDDNKGLVCKPEIASDKTSDLPVCDLIVIAVKSYDLDNALEEIKKISDKSTIILPLLNGVDIYERIRSKIDYGIVIPACVYVGTHIEKPGVVTQKGGDAKILFGKDPENFDFNPDEVKKLLKNSNIKFEFRDNPYSFIWSKFIFVAAYGLTTAGYGKSIGEIYNDANYNNHTREIMTEIEEIGKKNGVELPEDIVEQSLNKACIFPFETRTSYQRDIESNKEKNEGELFGGTIIRLGKKFGIPTPWTEKLYQKINKV